MERTQVLDLMGELKLYGMRQAYDEVMATSIKRQHEPPHIVGDLLKAEIAEKQARSIRYQFKIAKLPLAKDIDDFIFDGTPINPRAPGHVPGGSSAGSAAAVAAGLCDTALGTDTGGSVRVPASFCGIYGIRPTHGRLDLSGMMNQAPSSDTTGWFARDAATFARVSAVMLGEAIPANLPSRLVIATDAFGLADPATAAALEPLVARLGALIGEVGEAAMAPPGLAAWARAQRTLQLHEAWLTFQEWIDRVNPRVIIYLTQ